MKQIFVRGLSRSGGTLMATVLDAHPAIAMSYEIYQHLLEPERPGTDGIDDLIAAIDSEHTRRPVTAVSRGRLVPALAGAWRRWLGRDTGADAGVSAGSRALRFVGRAMRAGIEPATLRELLDDHVSRGLDFTSYRGRMLFVERVAVEKMKREGKQHWGIKIASAVDDLLKLYPDALILFMLRDGRDMAASRKLVGQFDKTTQENAQAWSRQVEIFDRLATERPRNVRLVRYERLASDPEAELRDIARFLGVEWSDRLLDFHQQDLSLYRHPTGHLSAEQVHQPISTSSVGRWKRDLTPEEIRTFEDVAGDCLKRFGYELSDASAASP